MSSYIPLVVIALALIAAGSIAYIAWELSSKNVQDEIEKSLGPRADSPIKPPDSSNQTGR